MATCTLTLTRPTLELIRSLLLWAGLALPIVANAGTLCTPPFFGELACTVKNAELFERKYGASIQDTPEGVRILAKNGEAVFFVREADDYGPKPSVIAALEPLNMLLVYVGIYNGEGRELHLVSLDTGYQIEILGWPLLSPDHEHILVHSEAVESSYHPNQLGIYKVGRQVSLGIYLNLEYMVNGDTASPTHWGPSEPVWIDNQTVEFTRIWIDEHSKKVLVRGAWETYPHKQLARLKLNRFGWHSDCSKPATSRRRN